MVCEICKAPYEIDVETRFSWSRVWNCTSMGHVSEGIILLFCLGCMVVMVQMMEPKMEGDLPTTDKGLIVLLFGLTIVMAALALKKVFTRWVASASETVIVERGDHRRRPRRRSEESAASRLYHAPGRGPLGGLDDDDDDDDDDLEAGASDDDVMDDDMSEDEGETTRLTPLAV